MDDGPFLLAFRNFCSHFFVHLGVILFCLVGSSMALTYISTGSINGAPIHPMHIIELNAMWGKWLYANFGKLSFSQMNYVKSKLILIPIVCYVLPVCIYIWKRKEIFGWRPYQPREKVYGDARWATEADIKRANLRAKQGLLLGSDGKGGYYCEEGFQHTLLFAPTGAGKGVGFVIPNLLWWHQSVVVHDIKLENYDLCSGWRQQQGQEIYVWEPANPDGVTHCYNPLDWISKKPGQMVDDVFKIASLLMPKQDFWVNEARSLFVAVTLYLIADVTKTRSFGEVVRTMRGDDAAYQFSVVLDTMGDIIHPVGYMNLAAFLQKADKERSGVISTMNSDLELWANPLIDTATASSDFNVLMFKKKKTTVYVGLTPDNIARLQKLMQVFYQQATEFLSRKMPNLKEEPFGVLFLVDEFPTLGKMEQFKNGIAYFRGYRVKLFLVVQDTQQLKGTYEDAGMNSFLSNSTYRITFAANNYETANLISQLCGNKTVENFSTSRPKFFDLNPASKTMNVSEVQRALLLPQEVITLPRDEQIILIESFPPIRTKKIFYYQDKTFTARLLPHTFVPTQEAFDPKKFSKKAKEEAKEVDKSAPTPNSANFETNGGATPRPSNPEVVENNVSKEGDFDFDAEFDKAFKTDESSNNSSGDTSSDNKSDSATDDWDSQDVKPISIKKKK